MSSTPDDRSKSIFDITPEQRDQRFQERLDKLKKELFSKGLPITYQDARCPTEDHFIREYEDGRIHLAVFDADNRVFIFVKDITNG